MAIQLSQISWHQKPGQVATYFNVGAITYSVVFNQSTDLFSSTIKQLFNSQAKITIPDDAWKITVSLCDETSDQDWTAGGLKVFNAIAEVIQHFEELIKPTVMVFICPNNIFKQIKKIFTSTTHGTCNVVPITGDVDSYFYLS